MSRGVRDSLSLVQFFVSDPFKIRHVKKDVVVRSGVDKPEALVRQPLDSSLSHSVRFLKKYL